MSATTKLKIHSKKDGFRRAGFTFRENEPTTIVIADLPKDSRDEIVKTLKEEPMLVVVEVGDDDVEAKSNASAAKDDQKELEKAAAKIADQKTAIDALKSTVAAQQDENSALSKLVGELKEQLAAATSELDALKANAKKK